MFSSRAVRLAWGGEIRTQPFGEDPGRPATCGIVEAADADLDDGPHAGDGQVRQGSRVAAVDAG